MSDLSNITALSGLTITSDQTTGTNNPNATFAVPCVTTAQRNLLQNVAPYVLPDNNTYKVKPGTMILNIDRGVLQIFIIVRNQTARWKDLFALYTNTAGVGLLSNNPFILPQGQNSSVEVSNNEINGFMYHDTLGDRLKIYMNGWKTITLT